MPLTSRSTPELARGRIVPRLILFLGSGAGLGKSTLSDFLFRQLAAHDVPAEWFYEEDALRLDPLRRFNEQWSTGDEHAMESYLEGVRQLTEEWRKDDIVRVVDSFIPGFFLFLGRYPPDEMMRFSSALRESLQPLDPLLIYLTGDVQTAWNRAVANRGAKWQEGIVPYLIRWPKPHYPGPPLHDEGDVYRFFTWQDGQTRELLKVWNGSILALDTVATPLPDCKRAILDRIGLAERWEAAPTAALPLEDYVGTFERVGEEGQVALTFSIDGEHLHVDAYWPAGSRLLPDGVDRFRLLAVNRHIVFERDTNGRVTSLRYTFRGREHVYRRV